MEFWPKKKRKCILPLNGIKVRLDMIWIFRNSTCYGQIWNNSDERSRAVRATADHTWRVWIKKGVENSYGSVEICTSKGNKKEGLGGRGSQRLTVNPLGKMAFFLFFFWSLYVICQISQWTKINICPAEKLTVLSPIYPFFLAFKANNNHRLESPALPSYSTSSSPSPSPPGLCCGSTRWMMTTTITSAQCFLITSRTRTTSTARSC